MRHFNPVLKKRKHQASGKLNGLQGTGKIDHNGFILDPAESPGKNRKPGFPVRLPSEHFRNSRNFQIADFTADLGCDITGRQSGSPGCQYIVDTDVPGNGFSDFRPLIRNQNQGNLRLHLTVINQFFYFRAGLIRVFTPESPIRNGNNHYLQH